MTDYPYTLIKPPAKDNKMIRVAWDDLVELRVANSIQVDYCSMVHFGDPELLALDPPELVDGRVTNYTIWVKNPNGGQELDFWIGMACTYNIILPTSIEMGITIWNRDYWGKGYGENVINQLTEYIFNGYNVQEIIMKTVKENLRALKCYAKCGYQQSGGNGKFIYLKKNRKEK